MRFKLLSVNNSASTGNIKVGATAKLQYDGKRFYFEDLYSSAVQSIVRDDTTLTIKTRNSVYVFEEEEAQ